MREGSECLRPHDTEVSDTTKATQLSEDSVEDISKKMKTQTGHHSFTTLVAVRIERPGQRHAHQFWDMWLDLQTIRHDTEAE